MAKTPHHKPVNVKLTSIARLRWLRTQFLDCNGLTYAPASEWHNRLPMRGDPHGVTWSHSTYLIYRQSCPNAR